MLKSALLLTVLSLSTVVYAQTPQTDQNACLEKEIKDFTRLLLTDGGRLKIGFLVEHITWFEDYQRAAVDVIQTQFPSNFVAAPDNTLGVVVLYISGTSVVSNGAQYISVRLQMNSSEVVLPENGDTLFDSHLHLAKIDDPIRSISGNLVLAEGGTLLSPIPQGMPFELWHQLNIQEVRKDVQKVLSEFLADWDKAGKK